MTSNPTDVLIERLSNCFGYNCASGETCQNHNEPLVLEARDEIERLRAALQQSRSAVVEECAKKVEEVWLDGEPYSECADWVRKLSQESADA